MLDLVMLTLLVFGFCLMFVTDLHPGQPASVQTFTTSPSPWGER